MSKNNKTKYDLRIFVFYFHIFSPIFVCFLTERTVCQTRILTKYPHNKNLINLKIIVVPF